MDTTILLHYLNKTHSKEHDCLPRQHTPLCKGRGWKTCDWGQSCYLMCCWEGLTLQWEACWRSAYKALCHLFSAHYHSDFHFLISEQPFCLCNNQLWLLHIKRAIFWPCFYFNTYYEIAVEVKSTQTCITLLQKCSVLESSILFTLLLLLLVEVQEQHKT